MRSYVAYVVLASLALGCSRTKEPAPAALEPTEASAGAAKAAAPTATENADSAGCPDVSRRYSVEIEGDGPRQRFAVGALRLPGAERYCEPAATQHIPGLTATGCADMKSPMVSCIWLRAEHGVYFDRHGQFWRLSVENFPTLGADGRLEGTLTAVGVPKHGSEKLQLKIHLTVGTDVQTTRAPEVWKQITGHHDPGVW